MDQLPVFEVDYTAIMPTYYAYREAVGYLREKVFLAEMAFVFPEDQGRVMTTTYTIQAISFAVWHDLVVVELTHISKKHDVHLVQDYDSTTESGRFCFMEHATKEA